MTAFERKTIWSKFWTAVAIEYVALVMAVFSVFLQDWSEPGGPGPIAAALFAVSLISTLVGWMFARDLALDPACEGPREILRPVTTVWLTGLAVFGPYLALGCTVIYSVMASQQDTILFAVIGAVPVALIAIRVVGLANIGYADAVSVRRLIFGTVCALLIVGAISANKRAEALVQVRQDQVQFSAPSNSVAQGDLDQVMQFVDSQTRQIRDTQLQSLQSTGRFLNYGDSQMQAAFSDAQHEATGGGDPVKLQGDLTADGRSSIVLLTDGYTRFLMEFSAADGRTMKVRAFCTGYENCGGLKPVSEGFDRTYTDKTACSTLKDYPGTWCSAVGDSASMPAETLPADLVPRVNALDSAG